MLKQCKAKALTSILLKSARIKTLSIGHIKSENTVETKNEVIIYDHNGVKITNLRAVFGVNIFGFLEYNITWIQYERVDVSEGFLKGMMVIGALLTAYGILRGVVLHWLPFGIGLLLVMVGAVLELSPEKESHLTFGDSYEGEYKYDSTNEAEIKEIFAAVSQAMSEQHK